MSPHRGSVTPLLIGTFILRVNGAAASIILGRFLAHLASEHGHSISSIHVGLIAVAYYAIELLLAPFMGAISCRIGRRFFLIVCPIVGLIQRALIGVSPGVSAFPQ